MNLGELRTRVRDLTGVYSSDIFSDALVNAWIDEAYLEVARRQAWGSAPSGAWSYSALGSDVSAPAFDAGFHVALAYRVAARLLAAESDDTQRGQFYTQEYERLLEDMAVFYFPRNTTGLASNRGELRRYVRDLAGAYSLSVSDGRINSLLNEMYLSVSRLRLWPWNPVVPMSTDADQPAFASEFRPVLAYMAASRLLAGQDGMDKLVAEYEGRAKVYVDDMVTEYFNSVQENVGTTGGDLVRQVRAMTLVQDDSFSDEFILSWVNQAYTELCLFRDWPWLEGYETYSVTYGADTFYLWSNTRRVLDVWFVPNQSDAPENIVSRPSLLDVPGADRYRWYDVDSDGKLTVGPSFTEAGELRVRFTMAPSTVTLADEPELPARFRPVLAYRVAGKIMQMLGEEKRAKFFDQEYASLVDQLVTEFLLDHDTTSLQLGAMGLETKKYVPWFRSA